MTRSDSSKSELQQGSDARLIVKTDGSGEPEHTLYSTPLSSDYAMTDAEYASALDVERLNDEQDVSVYIHLPFCPSRCLTCDHQTTVTHDSRQIDLYLDTIEKEMDLVTAHAGNGRRLQQLHLGGGTPNYLSEVQLVRLVEIIDRHFIIDDNTETSLEANAHRASVSQLSLLHGLGFRGLNLEVRDLDPHVQELLGRHQSASVIRDVVDNARSIGFNTVSMDLVYGLPQQTPSTIKGTVARLLTLDPDRVSCYTYRRRPERFQHQRAIDERDMPSLADKVSIFSRVVDGLSEAGYDWIGLDCFAKPADRISVAQRAGTLRRNSIGYTAQSGRRVIGFGSSSSSDLSTIAVRNHNGIEHWRGCIDRGELPVSRGQALSAHLRAKRHALSDLMCNLKLHDFDEILANDEEGESAIGSLERDGLVEISGRHVQVTEQGRYALHQLWGDASPSYRWNPLAGF